MRVRTGAVRLVIAAQLLTGAVALLAVVLVVVLETDGRRTAARDSCYLLRRVVLRATPPARRGQAVAWLNDPHNELHDCGRYADKLAGGLLP